MTFTTQGWPAQVEGDALTAEYSAPPAGPPPWHVYWVTPSTVFAFGTAEPGGATRFDPNSARLRGDRDFANFAICAQFRRKD
ncbi:MAG: hypothetical protein QOJ20_1735 [Mycobacterium sp.]|jgi:hypothetical protein|nr:hypothetical protein [Mycobacterium sp.]